MSHDPRCGTVLPRHVSRRYGTVQATATTPASRPNVGGSSLRWTMRQGVASSGLATWGEHLTSLPPLLRVGGVTDGGLAG